jgi:SAM-dependent methyltransferase
VLVPTVDFLAAAAEGGPCLEFGAGTGRVAVPLSRRGLAVTGIELSPAMAAHIGAGVDVVLGDFATTRVPRAYTMVFLLRNTITNLTTEAEQAAAFRNAAAHLRPGGSFVVENYIPRPASRRDFISTPEHQGYEEYDERNRIAVSHHRWLIDGEEHTFATPHRYVWPAELDTMASAAGLTLTERWADWHRSPFTDASPAHISVWAHSQTRA